MRVPLNDAAPASQQGHGMNLQAPRQEARSPLWYGWFGSIALHGLLFLSLLPLFRQSLITVPQERFHWDISLVQSAPTADKPIQTVDATRPTISNHSKPMPTPKHPARSNQQVASYAENTASLVPKTEAPATPEPASGTPTTADQPDKPTMTAALDEPTPNLFQTNAPPPQHAEPQIGSTTQTLPLQETQAATFGGENAAPTTIAESSSSPATVRDATVVSAARPDYGWLQQAIFHRLEKLKRASRPSLDEARPLKVLVKAVVSREGILLESSVVKSSGLERIDQEAMALVQRAFPMQLDRPLDRQQIAMRIPITYSRD